MNDYATSQSPALARLFENLENGNLTEAKKAAKRHSTFRISMFARQIIGWSLEKSQAAAIYLKDPSQESFQAYCDTP